MSESIIRAAQSELKQFAKVVFVEVALSVSRERWKRISAPITWTERLPSGICDIEIVVYEILESTAHVAVNISWTGGTDGNGRFPQASATYDDMIDFT